MLKKISSMAGALILLGGCATVDKNVVSAIQNGIRIANGVYLFASSALNNYNSRPVCGEPNAPKFYCKDLNTAETAGRVVVSFRLLIDSTQSQLNNIETSGLNQETILAALLTAGNNVLTIIDLFDRQSASAEAGVY